MWKDKNGGKKKEKKMSHFTTVGRTTTESAQLELPPSCTNAADPFDKKLRVGCRESSKCLNKGNRIFGQKGWNPLSACLVAHGGGSQVARKTTKKESGTVSDPESRAIPCSHPADRLCFRHHARPAACSRAKTKHFDSGYFAVKRDLLHWPPVFASDCCSLQHVLPARSCALRVRQEA